MSAGSMSVWLMSTQPCHGVGAKNCLAFKWRPDKPPPEITFPSPSINFCQNRHFTAKREGIQQTEAMRFKAGQCLNDEHKGLQRPLLLEKVHISTNTCPSAQAILTWAPLCPFSPKAGFPWKEKEINQIFFFLVFKRQLKATKTSIWAIHKLIKVYVSGKPGKRKAGIEAVSMSSYLPHWGQALMVYCVQNLPSTQGFRDDL